MNADPSSSQDNASSTGTTAVGNTGSESATSSTIKQDASGPSGSGGGITGRKRKVPVSVTPNACTNCKRARAKVHGPFTYIVMFTEILNRTADSVMGPSLLAEDVFIDMFKTNAITTCMPKPPRSR